MSVLQMASQTDLTQLVAQFNDFGQGIKYDAAAAPPAAAPPELLVLSQSDLADVGSPQHALFLNVLAERGFGDNRRVISASVALRVGWSSGFVIGTYVAAGLLAEDAVTSLVVEKGLVRSVVVHSASFRGADDLPEKERRTALARILYDQAEPFVASHHAWSRLSRRALFSMLESGWAGQFVGFGEALGRADWAAQEAKAVLASHPVLALDAPELYPIKAAGKHKYCQRRTLCCLYYKMPNAGYCGSCPILAEPDRTARQIKYVAEYGLPDGGVSGVQA